jgi:SAM-dependent methyltransferase
MGAGCIIDALFFRHIPARIGGPRARDRIGVGIYQSCSWQASRRRRRRPLPGARALAGLAMLTLACAAARAQVPFVPTPLEVVERMLSLAKVSADDYVVDLGSGDGRVVREAARSFGARGFGVEHDPELVARSQELARREGVADKVSFMSQDLFEAEIGDATVVTMYLLPAVNLKLRPRLLKSLRPGTRIVSHDFDMAEWAPDATAKLYAKDKYGAAGGESTVYLWYVPADVSGRWTWRLEYAGQAEDYELTASQRFQKVDAAVRSNGQARTVRDVQLQGDRLTFTVLTEVKGSSVRQTFSGRVRGDSIEGNVVLSGPRMQGATDWSAQRAGRAAGAAEAAPAGMSAQSRARALPPRALALQ